jgi:hypothetical protein
VLAGTVLSACAAAPSAPPTGPAPATTAAADALAFEAVLDGRCQILSAGGKLQVVTNTDPTRRVRYRLVRVFADTPQAGRVIGELGPGEGPVKLGCTRVDGREQRWDVLSAEFIDTDSETP